MVLNFRFLLYIFPESAEMVSSVEFKFQDYQFLTEGTLKATNATSGRDCLAIAKECIVGDRVRFDDKLGIVAQILPQTAITQLDTTGKH